MDNGITTLHALNIARSINSISARDYKMADWKYEKIMEQISEFQDNLPDTVDVCVRLACFGQSVVMAVNEIGYQNPDMLYFYGTVDGMEAQLIQHISQLNFLLIAKPKTEPTAKPRRIGFVIDEMDTESQKEDQQED